MIAIVLAMLVCVALGGLVVGYVAVEARRDGRELFTPEGEEMLASARRRQQELRGRGERLARKTVHSVRK
ncbi:hypothetical protein FNH13_13145 [Ornithinimicrobium ciconiae]|uniref:Uncharacterized protein n=1 Tax=Ornithinimicrobium ciconiae TaxID=2594265 RepID=A0A516GCE3_9MICO|nr:hypothetical protein [Ornithinimicrobium ciconiae]QDO89157.1 hypothetical protein FNH13_13145 [Ornithinimicrobium ciconiae]